MNDLVTWGALGLASATALGFLRFWQSYANQLSEAALLARTSKGDIDSLTLQLSALIGQFALYREGVAKDYITRQMMREFEDRVSITAKENTDRLSGEIKEVARRMDSVLLALAPKDR